MNVLFYVMDCLRKDHLSVYGYHRETAPNIAQLAKESVVFENAFSQATWTRPSAGSMLTGCYPAVHGAVTMQDRLSDKAPILPGILRDVAYRTAGFSAIAQVSSFTGFNRGFELYVDLFKERAVVEKRYFTGRKSDITLRIKEHILKRYFFKDRKINVSQGNMVLLGFLWVIFMVLKVRNEGCQHLEPEVFHIPDAVGTPLNHPDLVV